MTHNDQIFLSYASPDKERVEPYFDALQSAGFSPWMDVKKLLAGQNWDFELQRALDQSSIVIVFLSKNSRNRRGYVQREIKLALKKYEEKLVDDVFIIPVALEDVERPAELANIQFLDGNAPDHMVQLITSIRKQLAHLDHDTAKTTEIDDVTYRIERFTDQYDGIPGYEISADFIRLESTDYSSVRNAAEAINGDLSDSIMSARECAASPDPSLYNIGQAKWSRTNTLDMPLFEVSTSGRMLSVVHAIHIYNAGAAHPVSGFITNSFFLSPMTRVKSFKELLKTDDCLDYFQYAARVQLAEKVKELTLGEPDLNWIEQGTKDWRCFSNFQLDRGTVTFHFGSYAVAAYALGHQSVTIKLRDMAHLLTERAAHALDLAWAQ